MTETFNAQGIKGASAACPFREELRLTFESEDLNWAFLQAAFGALEEANVSATRQVAQSFVLEDVNATPNSTLTLPSTPVVGQPIYVADVEGNQYAVTATGAELEFTEGDFTGTKVTVDWVEDDDATVDKVIAPGKGVKLREVGVYGKFFGCPSVYSVAIPRGIISSNVELAVGDNPASASLEVMALRDPAGAFAYIRWLRDV
jgi:hypothetical protein